MNKAKYNVKLKIPKSIHEKMLEDLSREHPFAYERVGFLFTSSKVVNSAIIIIAKEYVVIDDNHYEEDNTVGAKINSNAIRKAMQRLLTNKTEGCFHVHLHNHKGKTYPSYTDNKGLLGLVESFSNITYNQANGYLILSQDSFFATVKIGSSKKLRRVEQISVVGYPSKFVFSQNENLNRKIFERQSFLGSYSQQLFQKIKVGVIGYGGGGSHIGQQLAHLGVKNILIYDDDRVEDTNLNRLIGARFSDIEKKTLKTDVAKRTIRRILPYAEIEAINSKWQENPEILQTCDIVFGCVDSFIERQQLETECRRYLIPYIDIGMDVNKVDKEYYMSGQVILSMPGMPCFKCSGFITDEKLGLEATKYGDVGGVPQVVWANGVLASIAVGVFVDIITGWGNNVDKKIYYSYDGNSGTISNHIRLNFTANDCLHYPLEEVGTPVFKKL